MRGGLGDDAYFVNETSVFAGNVQVGGDVIVENANEGNDVVFASVSYTLPDNIEQLSLINGTGTGNGLNNTFFSDHPFTSKIFRGGGGDDTYFVIDQRDGIEEDPDGGIETVWVGSLAFSYTLTDPDVENLAITGQRVVGTGKNIDATLDRVVTVRTRWSVEAATTSISSTTTTT